MLFASFSIRISMFFIAQRLFSTKTPIKQCTLLLSEQFTLERFRFLLPFTNNNVLHSHTMLYNGLNFAKRSRIHCFLSALGRWSKRAQFILTVNKTRAKTTQHHHQDNQLRYTRDTLELSRCIKLHPHQYGLLRIECGRKTTIQAHPTEGFVPEDSQQVRCVCRSIFEFFLQFLLQTTITPLGVGTVATANAVCLLHLCVRSNRLMHGRYGR